MRSLARAWDSVMANQVLPTPPLPEAMAMMRPVVICGVPNQGLRAVRAASQPGVMGSSPSAAPGPMPASVSARLRTGGCRQDAAQAMGQIEPRGHQQFGARRGVGEREVSCFRHIQAGGQHQHDGSVRRGGQCRQLVQLARIEWVVARRVDQDRNRVLPLGQCPAECDRMAGDDQADPKQFGEGGELFGGAGTLAIGGDHHRGHAGHHQPGRQSDDGQGLASARRSDQQQRPLAGVQRQRGELHRTGQGNVERAILQGCVKGGVEPRGSPAQRAGRGRAAPTAVAPHPVPARR